MSRTTQVSGVLLGLWKGRQPGQTSGSLDLMRRPVSCFAPGPGGSRVQNRARRPSRGGFRPGVLGGAGPDQLWANLPVLAATGLPV